jgi:integrase
MALYQRGKKSTWWYEFVVHGRRYRESTGTTSEQLAQKIERKRHRELEAAAGGIELQKVRPVLFGVAADDWLKLKEPMLAEKTRAMYTSDVAHLRPHFGKLLVTDITARDIADYIRARRQDSIADKSIRNELGTLRAVLKKHRRWEAIKDDVMLPKGREDVGQALSVEEEERLLVACAKSHSRSLVVAVTLALNTGMRHDEIRLLRWRQVDLKNEAITVGKSKTEHGTGRAVPLNQRALAVLQGWAQQFPARKPQHYVFASEKVGHSFEAGMMTAYDVDPAKPILSWKTSWTTARTAAGVSCRFHDLRHTTVTRLLERGASFATVATVMGWSPGTAMKMAKRYGHIGKSAQREALALLDMLPTKTPKNSTPDLPLRPTLH